MQIRSLICHESLLYEALLRRLDPNIKLEAEKFHGDYYFDFYRFDCSISYPFLSLKEIISLIGLDEFCYQVNTRLGYE